MPHIRTRRLLIRRAEPTDLGDIHAFLSDAMAMRYWSTSPHTSLEQTRAWLDAMIAAPIDQSDDYVVVHGGRVIGKAGFWRLPEIGYIFHPSAWGQGLAAEALEAVIGRAFAGHRLRQVVADVDPRNAASLRILARLGFVETGRAARTIEVAGEWCDSVYLALSQSGFANRSRTRIG